MYNNDVTILRAKSQKFFWGGAQALRPIPSVERTPPPHTLPSLVLSAPQWPRRRLRCLVHTACSVYPLLHLRVMWLPGRRFCWLRMHCLSLLLIQKWSSTYTVVTLTNDVLLHLPLLTYWRFHLDNLFGCQSTRHSPKSYDELTGGWNNVLWQVDRRLKRHAVTAVTS